ncbi:hypothetical protein [Streptomyces sp. NPDC093089]|uniref:hypothetical protein n=1 Tax=Streptomyces sp. NPDC093089 TaxID=3366024 RepID=UPI003815F862
MNSGTTEFDAGRTVRFPDGKNNPGCGSDVFGLRAAPGEGGDRVEVRFGSEKDAVRPGALFLQADVRR